MSRILVLTNDAAQTTQLKAALGAAGLDVEFAHSAESDGVLVHDHLAEQMLSALMDHVPDGIYFKDLDSRFLRVNRSVARRFGFDDPNELIGKCDHDFFQSESATRALRDEQQVIRSGKPIVSLEEPEVWPDGHVTWASTTKMPLSNRSGEIIGTFGISRDITQRKCEEAEIRKAKDAAEDVNRVLDSILKNLADGVVVADESGQFIHFNAVAERLLGLGAENVGVEKWSSLYGVFLPDRQTPYPAHELPSGAGHARRSRERCRDLCSERESLRGNLAECQRPAAS